MRIGIITGSGTYALPGLHEAVPHDVATRFGTVEVSVGSYAGADVVHISRHGEGHARLSSAVNHRANIVAMRELGVQAILSVTVCGTLDPQMELGSLVVFDDLHFLANRLGDGALCTLYDEPGEPGRGHWVFAKPFSEPLRRALVGAAGETVQPVRDGGCYGHVDGPRFNTATEIAQLRAAGVTCVSQTAGPETVLAGEAEIPYALLGYATDYANAVKPDDPTPVDELISLVEASRATFATVLSAAVPRVLAAGTPSAVGSHFRFD